MLGAWFFWICAVSFYFYQFILRVSPSVMIKELMTHFAIDATAVGILAGFYYKAYTLMQIPTGMLVDKLGPRRLILGYGSLCVVGAAAFAWAPNITVAYIGRFLMGLGSVAGLLGTARVIQDYFPAHRVGFMMSLTMTLGTIGGLAGGTPTALLVEHVGYKTTLWILASLGILVIAFVGSSLRDVPRYQTFDRKSEKTSLTAGLWLALRTPQVMISGLCAMGLYLPLSVFADLWGPNFIMAAYDVPRSTAAGMVSLIYIGLCIGSIGFALLAEKLGRRLLIILGLAGTCGSLAILLWATPTAATIAGAIMLFMGICTGAEMLCFTNAVHYMPVQYGGVTVAIVNMLAMVTGAVFQPVVGYILDWARADRLQDGLPVYVFSDYQLALSTILACAILTLGASLYLREHSGTSPTDIPYPNEKVDWV
jgi:MFS family permease